jgi:hypothetical protein
MYAIVLLVFLHIVGNSVLTDDNLKKQKIHSVLHLLKHVGIYTLVFLICSPIFLGLTIIQALIFSLLNGFMHFVIEFFSIKIKLRYWIKDVYAVVIITSVLEHFLNLAILIGSYYYMFPQLAHFENIIKMIKEVF